MRKTEMAMRIIIGTGCVVLIASMIVLHRWSDLAVFSGCFAFGAVMARLS